MSNIVALNIGYGYKLKLSDCCSKTLDEFVDQSLVFVDWDNEEVFLFINIILGTYDGHWGINEIDTKITTSDINEYAKSVQQCHEHYKQLTGKYPHERYDDVKLYMFGDIG